VQQLKRGKWKNSSEHGDIVCEHVANAAEIYARQVGEWAGLELPIVNMPTTTRAGNGLRTPAGRLRSSVWEYQKKVTAPMSCSRPRSDAVVKAAIAAVHWLPALLLLSAGGTTLAGQSRGNQLICDQLQQRHVVNRNQLDSRTLNFFLFDAAERGCMDLLQRFLDLGASVEARDKAGNIALQIAARSGERKAVGLLLARGSDLHHTNLAGSTALLQATMAERRRVAKILLRAEADPNARNTQGITPLAAAAFNGSDRMVDMLLQAGADPDHVDRTGKAPIVYAAGRGYTGIVARLLDAGVKVDARYSHDLSALMWAAGHSNDVPVGEGLSTVKLLVDRGAKLDLVDDRGRSALMTAAQRDHSEIATLLIARGADATLADRQGRTALEIAGSETLRQTLQALLEKKAISNQ